MDSLSRDRLLRLYRPGKLEVLAWTLGLLLIVAYLGTKWWSAADREAALSAFREQQQSVSTAPTEDAVIAGALPPLESIAGETELSTSAPDTTLWSASRIAAFFGAVAQPAVPEAVLEIPGLRMEVPVYHGTSEWNLNRGAGRIEGTAAPGAAGNVGIAAHRDGYFRGLADIRLGERVMLSTLEGVEEYRVTSIRIVTPDTVEVLAPTDVPSLTLVTCYPFYHVGPAPERFIVRAEQVPDSTSAQLSTQRRERAEAHEYQAAHAD